MYSYMDFPEHVIEDIVRLRRRIDEPKKPQIPVPQKIVDRNLLVASWNIFRFGQIHPSFDPNPDSPKRNLHSLACIAEVIRRFDVIAIQEVMPDTVGIRTLMNDFLGPDWGIVLSDVNAGHGGNNERFAYLYDKRRVTASGLAGEIVLPPREEDDTEELGQPVDQFDRAPYIVGFRSGNVRLALLTAHIRYGEPEERIPELEEFAEYVAKELRERSRIDDAEESNLVVLGDFNIDERGDNPLFRAFRSTGLHVPQQLHGLPTTTGQKDKFYDQIAWFLGDLTLDYTGKAGVIDFVDAVFKDLTSRQLPSRVSDHFPIWVEFAIDRSVEEMGRRLGLDETVIFSPNPFGSISD